MGAERAPRATVLVVENDAAIRALTESVLALSHLEVVSASSVPAALDARGDVALVDRSVAADPALRALSGRRA